MKTTAVYYGKSKQNRIETSRDTSRVTVWYWLDLDILKHFWTFWNNLVTRIDWIWTFWNTFGHSETIACLTILIPYPWSSYVFFTDLICGNMRYIWKYAFLCEFYEKMRLCAEFLGIWQKVRFSAGIDKMCETALT